MAMLKHTLGGWGGPWGSLVNPPVWVAVKETQTGNGAFSLATRQTVLPSRDQHNTWVIGRVLGENAPVALLYPCPDGSDIAEVNYTFLSFAKVKTT